jgi:SAM-dependent methyltransferase
MLVDEFHIRGKEATEELSGLAELGPDRTVLGGSCRYLAATLDFRTTGVDLTPEYVELSERLSSRVGLTAVIDFRVGSALDMPFDDDSFNVVWIEHAQMNIEDKGRFYSEIHRVRRDGGRLVFHNIFADEEATCAFQFPGPAGPRSTSCCLPPSFATFSSHAAFGCDTGRTRPRHFWSGCEQRLSALVRAGHPPSVSIC